MSSPAESPMRVTRRLPSWALTLIIALVVYVIVLLTEGVGLMNPYWYQIIQLAGITAISALGLNLIYGFNGQFSLGHIGFYAIGAYGSALITKDLMVNWSGTRIGALAWMIAGQVGILVVLFAARLLRLGPIRKRLAAGLAGYLKPYESGLIVLLVTLVLSAVAIAVGVCAAWGLQLVLSAIFRVLLSLPQALARGIVFLIALLTGGTMAALIAYLVGLPLLRLSSDYFGIATLGFSVMIYTALQNSDQVIPTMKGARGMVGIPTWTTWTWVFWALLVVVFLMRHLVHSSYGRAIISIREDEIAAKTMGIDAAQSKATAFAVGGFFAGVAGGLYAHLFGFLHPSTFNFIKGFDPLIIVVFGGLGSMTGTILGSVLFALLIEGLRVLLPQGFEDWRFVIYPIILLLVMLLRPQGLMGTTEWGWLRAPLPPERDIPVPDRATQGQEA